jgi:hypothetical protein
MMEAGAAAREQLRAIARDLSAIRYRLLGVIASLADGISKDPGEEDDERSDLMTEMRSVAECVLADNIRPAIDDLLAAAGYQGGRVDAR